MNLVLIIVMLVGFLACGMAFIKWQRRKELKDRSKKLKIAQGDFSEEELPKPKPKKRKRRAAWFSDGPDDGLPSHVESELLTAVPSMVDKLFATRATASELRIALLKLESEYAAAARKVDYVVLPQRLDRADMSNWWNELIQAVRSKEQLSASYWQTRTAFVEAGQVHIDIVQRFQKFLKQLEPHDLDELSEEARVNLALLKDVLAGRDIGAAAFGTVPEKVKVPVPPVRPEQGISELSEPFSKLEPAVRAMLDHLVKLTAGANSLQGALARSCASWQEPELERPQKPVDADINALLARIERWAAQATKHEEDLNQVKSDVDFSRLQTQAELARMVVDTLFSAIRAFGDQRSKQKADAEAATATAGRPGPRRPWENGSSGKADAASRQDSETSVQSAKGRWGFFGGGGGAPKPLKPYVTSLLAPPSRFGVEPVKTAQPSTWSDLTLEQFILQTAATRVYALSESAIKTVVKEVGAAQSKHEGERPKLPFARTGEVVESTTSGAVATANRKFCFAVAQLSVAETKLHRAESEPEAEVDSAPSVQSEKDGASYVRRYQQWQKEVQAATLANEKRAEKIAALAAQRDERRKQAEEAQGSIGAIRLSAEAVNVPSELEKQLHVARVLSRGLKVA